MCVLGGGTNVLVRMQYVCFCEREGVRGGYRCICIYSVRMCFVSERLSVFESMCVFLVSCVCMRVFECVSDSLCM